MEVMDVMEVMEGNRRPTVSESVAIVETATGRQFLDRDWIGSALKAAHRDKDTRVRSEGNRDAARSAIITLNQCINKRSAIKHSHEWHHAQNVYTRFNRRDDLIHIAEVTGIEACIAHSERQELASPKVKAFAIRALISAVFCDSGGDLDAVCSALDHLAVYLPQQSQSQPPNLSEQLQSQSQSQSPPLPQASSEGSDPSAFSPSTSDEMPVITPTTSLRDSTFSDSTGSSSSSSLSSSSRAGTSGISQSEQEDANQSSDIEMGDVSTRNAEIAAVEPRQHLSRGKLTAIADLGAYVRRQQDKALQIGAPPAPSSLPLGFLEAFSAQPTSFRDPDVVFKLYLSPMSPHTTSSVRRAIMSIRNSSQSWRRAPLDSDSRVQSHYEAIKRVNETSAASSILLRYHLHRLYVTTRDRRETDFDGGFVNETSSSYLANPRRGAGNPISGRKAAADAALVRKLEPDFDSKPEAEQSRLKTQVRDCVRLGQRLDKLVDLVGYRGILCLLPSPAMDATQPNCLSIGRENLNTIKDNEFKAVLGAWTRNIDQIRRFGAASEPILDILVNEPNRPQYGRFRMESTHEGEIEEMVHGSEDLLHQFDRDVQGR